MRSRITTIMLVVAVLALLVQTAPDASARGGGGRGGGGGGRVSSGGGSRSSGGGSFSRSGGSSSYSRPSSGRAPSAPVSRPSYTPPARPSYTPPARPAYTPPARPSTPISRPAAPVTRPVAPVSRPSSPISRPTYGGAAQLPSASRSVAATRPSAGSGNYLGMQGGSAPANRSIQRPAAAAGAVANRGNLNQRPQERANWTERSQNRDDAWRQRVDNRQQAWNQRVENRQTANENFQQNREQRWEGLENRRNDVTDRRTDRREDWQNYREDLWDYRYDRADEVWDDVRDYHDDLFDDYYWGHHYGHNDHYYYHGDSWWWWQPVTWDDCHHYVYDTTPVEPVYADYGPTNTATVIMAAAVEAPPPPLPPAAEGQPAEWLPLGVYSLVQEEKGDPNLFMQLSLGRDGRISGAYENVASGSQKPIAGQLDKQTQHVSWRIGDNRDVACTSTLGNLTKDISPVALCYSDGRVENWLLVRLPEPAKDGQPKAPELQRGPPPPEPKAAPAAVAN